MVGQWAIDRRRRLGTGVQRPLLLGADRCGIDGWRCCFAIAGSPRDSLGINLDGPMERTLTILYNSPRTAPMKTDGFDEPVTLRIGSSGFCDMIIASAAMVEERPERA